MYFMSLSELYGYIDSNEPKGILSMFKSNNADIKAAVNQLAEKQHCVPWSPHIAYKLQTDSNPTNNPTFGFNDIAPIIPLLVSTNPSGCQKAMLTGAINAYFLQTTTGADDPAVKITVDMLNKLKSTNSLTVDNITKVKDTMQSLGTNAGFDYMAASAFEKAFSKAPGKTM